MHFCGFYLLSLIRVHIRSLALPLHHPCGIPDMVPTFVDVICVHSLPLCLYKDTIM